MNLKYKAICLEGTDKSIDRALYYLQLAIKGIRMADMSLINIEDVEYLHTLNKLYYSIEKLLHPDVEGKENEKD